MADEDITEQIRGRMKKIALIVTGVLILGLVTFLFFSRGSSKLFKGFMGSNNQEYSLEVVKIFPVSPDETECIANSDCNIKIKIKKTGSGIPTDPPKVMLKINGEIIKANIEVYAVKSLGANEGDVYFTIPANFQFTNGAAYAIQVDIVGGTFTTIDYTAPETTGTLTCPNTMDEFYAYTPITLAANDDGKTATIDMVKAYAIGRTKIDTDKAESISIPNMILNGIKSGSNSEIPIATTKIVNTPKVIPIYDTLQKLKINFQPDFYNGVNHPYNVEEIKLCATPSGTENCSNGQIDDDGDGFADCHDAYCAFKSECAQIIADKIPVKFKRGDEDVDFLDLSKDKAELSFDFIAGHLVNNKKLVIKAVKIYKGDQKVADAEIFNENKSAALEQDKSADKILNLEAGIYKYEIILGYADADGPIIKFGKEFEIKLESAKLLDEDEDKDEADDSDEESPPTISLDFEDPKIKITKALAEPPAFNPTIATTKITYALSQDAKLDIQIVDLAGKSLVKLIDNKDTDVGEYFVNWDGKKDGKVVTAGKYKYQILAKNPTSGETEDTAEEELTLIYAAPVETAAVAATPPPATPPPTTPPQQAAATVNLQKATTTSDTGPGILIYFLFPLGGYLLSRKKRQQ